MNYQFLKHKIYERKQNYKIKSRHLIGYRTILFKDYYLRLLFRIQEEDKICLIIFATFALPQFHKNLSI